MDVNTEEIPRIEPQEPEKLSRVQSSSSPPPNCAICLGSCTNKCFTDCCLHQFCFNCLLEWSKIKAECPLCKQPFKSIIYNIKSNNEYEEHVITHPERQTIDDDIIEPPDPFNNFYLPNEPRPRPQRHFQFRTTLTLDHGGELAMVQRLLLSHPLTNTIYMPSHSLNRYSQNPMRSIAYRRAIYQNDWWAAPDMSGRYRECIPQFFRENPGQLHRISPWLNRELSALMVNFENIYVAQEIILDILSRKHILSNSFRRTIAFYIPTNHVDHFIHEFYHYARSQFDMMGYDSHVRYNFRRPESLLSTFPSSESEDSDVRVIDSPTDCIYVAPRTPEVIVIHSDNSDSDVIYQAPTPPPVVVVDSGTDNENIPNENSNTNSSKLPIKLRLKLKKTPKKRKSKRNRSEICENLSNSSDSESECPRACYRIQGGSSSSSSSSDSSTSSSSSSSSSSSDSDSSYCPQKAGNTFKRVKCQKKRSRKICMPRHLLRNKSKKRPKYNTSTDSDSTEKNYAYRKPSKKDFKNKRLRRSSITPKNNVSYFENSSSNENMSNTNLSFENNNSTSPNIKQELPTSIPLNSLENPSEILNLKVGNDEEIPNSNIDGPGPSSSYTMPSVIINPNKYWYKNEKKPYYRDSSSYSE